MFTKGIKILVLKTSFCKISFSVSFAFENLQAKKMNPFGQKIKKGMLLVAEPFLQDENFRGAVILICDHNAEGTFGLIVNRSAHIPVSSVVENFSSIKQSIFYGGPVQPETLHFVHTIGKSVDASIAVADGIFWGGHIEIITAMAELGQLKKNEVRFFSGYAGWEPDQLQFEINNGDWYLCEADVEILFHTKPDDIWQAALHKLGGNYEIISDFNKTQSLN